MPEWVKFKVGKPSTRKNWTEPDCQPLERIYHVTHIGTAARMLSDGLIKSGLVYDKSKLNNERIQVVWLSPNDWLGAGGSRYGNIRLSFDFESLVRKKKYYWVESIAYHPPAVRILVSDSNYSQILTPYDPKVGNGPWWFDSNNGVHYWNGKYCLEIMHEGDINLESATKIDSVKHHPNFCSISGSNCPDCGLEREPASGRFLATFIGLQLDPRQIRWVVGENPDLELIIAWNRLKRDLLKVMPKGQFNSPIPVTRHATNAIGRAILAAYSRGDLLEVRALAAELMPSKQAAVEACAKVIAKDFGINDWKVLEDY